jgi:hypothetical protein
VLPPAHEAVLTTIETLHLEFLAWLDAVLVP